MSCLHVLQSPPFSVPAALLPGTYSVSLASCPSYIASAALPVELLENKLASSGKGSSQAGQSIMDVTLSMRKTLPGPDQQNVLCSNTKKLDPSTAQGCNSKRLQSADLIGNYDQSPQTGFKAVLGACKPLQQCYILLHHPQPFSTVVLSWAVSVAEDFDAVPHLGTFAWQALTGRLIDILM